MFSRAISLIAAFFLSAAFLCSCGAVRYNVPAPDARDRTNEHWKRAFQLEDALLNLDPGVDPEEARAAARTAVFYSLELANRYELTRPPLIHNTLVNAGLKPRGLCIHWAGDLLEKLRSLKLKTLEYHWGVANKHALLRIEHSTVVVCARGRPFEEGLVLDPWRNSGRLFFSPVLEDDYTWEKW